MLIIEVAISKKVEKKSKEKHSVLLKELLWTFDVIFLFLLFPNLVKHMLYRPPYILTFTYQRGGGGMRDKIGEQVILLIEVQTTMYKISYKAVMYSTGNTVNIL